MRRAVLTSIVLTGLALAVAFQPAAAQRGDDLLQRRRAFSEPRDKELETIPFKGITANGEVERGLFTVRATGVSTVPVQQAARAFLAALTPAQRSRTQFAVDDLEWRRWANQDSYLRQGLSFVDMSPEQRDKAFALMRAALSAKGFRQTRDIMRLNHTLGELNDNNFERYGEWQYFMTVMGEPSATEPWGWQFDGHHAAINYFVLGDQVVATPLFAGSEPAIAHDGAFKGTVVLQDEQSRGLALVNALPAALRAKAILNDQKTGANTLAEAFHDNVVLDYAGVRASELPDAQRRQLVDLIALHVSNIDDGQARVKMDEVRRHLDRTTFAWIGGTSPQSVFYYRVHSPVILIEFDHQPPVGLLPPPGTPRVPNREHIHTVVRTPNGNDYGKDLLRQHYAQHPH